MLRPLHIALLELKRYLGTPGELAFSLALPVVLFALMYGAFGERHRFTRRLISSTLTRVSTHVL